jgi:hypothetical protein
MPLFSMLPETAFQIRHIQSLNGSPFSTADPGPCHARNSFGPPARLIRAMVYADGAFLRTDESPCHHPGFHLQIIVLTLLCHFFLMRPEIVYALSDFVAFRRWQDDWCDVGGGLDRIRCLRWSLFSCSHRDRQIWNWLGIDGFCKRHRALYQSVQVLLPIFHHAILQPISQSRHLKGPSEICSSGPPGSKFIRVPKYCPAPVC